MQRKGSLPTDDSMPASFLEKLILKAARVNLKKLCRDSWKLITEPRFRSKVDTTMLRRQLLEMVKRKKWLEEERERLEEHQLTLIIQLLGAEAEIRRRNESQDDLLGLLGRLEDDRRRSKEKCHQAEQQANDLMKLYAGALSLAESHGESSKWEPC